MVPNANPDGSFRERTRTNAGERNLNRAWGQPSLEEPPEVVALLIVLNDMELQGCGVLLGIHGDKGITIRPVLCCTPAWTPKLHALQEKLHAAVTSANPDFPAEGSAHAPRLLCTLSGPSPVRGRLWRPDGQHAS